MLVDRTEETEPSRAESRALDEATVCGLVGRAGGGGSLLAYFGSHRSWGIYLASYSHLRTRDSA